MEKSTKKKIRILVSIIAAILLLTVLAVNIECFRGVTISSCAGNSARSIGTLTSEDTAYQQYFVPQRDKLSYIEVRFGTYSQSAEGTVAFAVLDSSGKVLCQSETPVSSLADDQYYRFPVDASLKQGVTYSFTLKAKDLGYTTAPVVWVSIPSAGEETSLVLPKINTGIRYQTYAQFGYSYFNMPAFIGCIVLILLCCLIFFLPFKLSGKYGTLAGTLIFLLYPVAMFFIVEVLNENSALDKITQAYLVNYVFYLLIYLVFFVLINRLRISMLVSNTIIYILAVINYFKILFRGEPLQPWDIFAAKTALNVASSYAIGLTLVLIETFLCFLLMNLISWKVDFSIKRIRWRVLTGVLSAGLSVMMVFSLFGTDRYAVAAFNFMQKIGITNNVWNQPSNYAKNGLVIAFTMNAQYMNVDKPSGYSAENVAEIKSSIEAGNAAGSVTYGITEAADTALSTSMTLSSAGETDTTAAPTPSPTPAPAEIIPDIETPILPGTSDTGVLDTAEAVTEDTVSKPNIIAIMCESYADLTTVADYTTNMEVTPFYDSVSDNVIKGSLYVSTYGGGTANTEFEFLTGNSMAFLPNGSIPYQQYIDSPTGSLAQILKSEGYSTIAVHPYRASGWNRESVYPYLGFDEFLSQDDFTNPTYMRGYISDACSYKKLIELYENKPEGQPIFLFNVTMQNHGGYSTEYGNFQEDVKLTDYTGEFPETEQYLSLIHQSDSALKDLIDYFEAADEPTVICFFGDHLPNLKNNFYETILGEDLSDLSSEEMLNLYQTPFLIWANYDIGEQEIDAISANYLSTLLLQTANIALPDYNLYLSSLYQSFPVISSMAVIDSAGNTYESAESAPGNDAINTYSILTYNNLFDKNGRDATLFDSASSSARGEGIMITGIPLSEVSGGTDPTGDVGSDSTSAASAAGTASEDTVTPAA